MTSKHKLAHLRDLDHELRCIAAAAEQFIAEGQDKALTKLIAAEAALRAVATTLQELHMEASPLVPLYADVLALVRGSKPSAMLVPALVGHRRMDAPLVAARKAE